MDLNWQIMTLPRCLWLFRPLLLPFWSFAESLMTCMNIWRSVLRFDATLIASSPHYFIFVFKKFWRRRDLIARRIYFSKKDLVSWERLSFWCLLFLWTCAFDGGTLHRCWVALNFLLPPPKYILPWNYISIQASSFINGPFRWRCSRWWRWRSHWGHLLWINAWCLRWANMRLLVEFFRMVLIGQFW